MGLQLQSRRAMIMRNTSIIPTIPVFILHLPIIAISSRGCRTGESSPLTGTTALWFSKSMCTFDACQTIFRRPREMRDRKHKVPFPEPPAFARTSCCIARSVKLGTATSRNEVSQNCPHDHARLKLICPKYHRNELRLLQQDRRLCLEPLQYGLAT